MRTPGLRLILAGAAIGNGNRGVEALGRSVIDGVHREVPGSHVAVLDDGWGVRRDTSARYAGSRVEHVGVRLSRRWHRPESWAQVRVAQATAPRLNGVARRFGEADAVLDLSAGDSFTDLYGMRRLMTVTAPKESALRAGRPLVLLPQTYGPFASAEARRLAERIVRSATAGRCSRPALARTAPRWPEPTRTPRAYGTGSTWPSPSSPVDQSRSSTSRSRR